MKGNSKNSGTGLIICGIICFICSFFANNGINASKPSKVKSLSNGKLSDVGYIGGNSEGTEFFTMLFWAFIVAGIILLLLGIIVLAASSQTSETSIDNKGSTNSSCDIFINCPNCGETNGVKNEYCYKCKTKLRQNTEDNNTWLCPDCGRRNQNYVGTCGCGRSKTR